VRSLADELGVLHLSVDADGLKGDAAFRLADLLAGLTKATDAVESAALSHVDWRREVELIKANSTR
jgi:hypothetical protein